jgi:hypothetical protein
MKVLNAFKTKAFKRNAALFAAAVTGSVALLGVGTANANSYNNNDNWRNTSYNRYNDNDRHNNNNRYNDDNDRCYEHRYDYYWLWRHNCDYVRYNNTHRDHHYNTNNRRWDY